MPKVDPKKIKSNWSLLERRPPWNFLSSAELAKVLGLHLQTISNWRIRGVLPAPESHRSLKGNKCYYRITTIRAWLEDRPEEIICWEWLYKYMDIGVQFRSLDHAKDMATMAYQIYGFEKPIVD